MTAPRHKAGLYIKVSSDSQCCALPSDCASPRGSILTERWVGGSDLWDEQRALDPPLRQASLGFMDCLPLCAGLGDTWEHGILAVDSHKVTHKLVIVGTGTELLRFFFFSVRDGH